MCGRYSLAAPGQAILSDLDCDGGAGDWSPVYSVAPRTLAPVVRDRLVDDTRTRELEASRWGLHPSSAKDSGPRPINARLETAATNGMFRAAFASSRALVPMTGYYEWQEAHEDGKKVKNPSYIHSPNSPVLAAAGLAAARHDEDRDEWTTTFTIITRTGEDAAGDVHDRMPVFLSPAAWGQWLDPAKVDDKDALLDVLDVESRRIAATLTTYRVSRDVNNVRTLDRTDPDLITLLN